MQASILLLWVYVSGILFLIGTGVQIAYLLGGGILGIFVFNVLVLSNSWPKWIAVAMMVSSVIIAVTVYQYISTIPLILKGTLLVLGFSVSSIIIIPTWLMLKPVSVARRMRDPFYLSLMTTFILPAYLLVYFFYQSMGLPEMILISEGSFFVLFLLYSIFVDVPGTDAEAVD